MKRRPSLHLSTSTRQRIAWRPLLAIATFFLAAGVTRSASAYERTLSVGLEIGFAHSFAADMGPGQGVAIDVSYGFSETLDLRGFVAGSAHGAFDGLSVLGGVELIYAIDIASFVPWFGGGVIAGGDIPPLNTGRGFLGACASVGVDYLVSRSVVLGLVVRGSVHPLGFDESPGTFFAGLRFAMLFELF